MCASRAVFRPQELAYCRSRPDPVASLSGLIAAKEAFIKAVGGFPGSPPFVFTDVEVTHAPSGRPRFVLHGALRGWCVERGIASDLSVSHSGGLAGAVVLLEWRLPPT